MKKVILRETPLRFTSSLDENDEARKTDTLNLLPYAEALRHFIYECETLLGDPDRTSCRIPHILLQSLD